MTKTVLKYGLIAGIILALLSLAFWSQIDENFDMNLGMVVGYATMLLSFSTVYFGIRTYRKQLKEKALSFGAALAMGLMISLIASVMYSLAWTIFVEATDSNFMEVYANSYIEGLKEDGATAAEITSAQQSMEEYKEIYKNPGLVFLFTLIEPLPVGIIVSLFCGLMLRQKKTITE